MGDLASPIAMATMGTATLVVIGLGHWNWHRLQPSGRCLADMQSSRPIATLIWSCKVAPGCTVRNWDAGYGAAFGAHARCKGPECAGGYSALHGCDMPPRYHGHPWFSPTRRPYTPKQRVEFAPRTVDHSGQCKRASAKTGSTYLVPHITDLGRTAREDRLNLPPYSAHTRCSTHSESLAIAIQALPSIRVSPETACSAHGHGGDKQ